MRLAAQPTRDIPSPHSGCRIYISHAPGCLEVGIRTPNCDIPSNTRRYIVNHPRPIHTTKQCQANRKQAIFHLSICPFAHQTLGIYKQHNIAGTNIESTHTRYISSHLSPLTTRENVVPHRTTYPPTALYHIITCSHSHPRGGCRHSTACHNSQGCSPSRKDSKMVRLSTMICRSLLTVSGTYPRWHLLPVVWH